MHTYTRTHTHHTHSRTGHIDHARRLYERAVHLKASTKKMKHFFKRYLDFESKHGSAVEVQHVRDSARAFVESLTQ